MKRLSYQIINNGDAALTIIFDAQVSEDLSIKIIQICHIFKHNFSDILLEIIPGYQSITLCYPALSITQETLRQIIESLLNNESEFTKLASKHQLKYRSKLIEVPVCYDKVFAPDLASVAAYCQLSETQVIALHSKTRYLVHMLGFLPGFLYLGGLAPELNCPRKATPALRISAGSVGIGGNQTGIYPVQSPGGWHIIGRTPVNLFNPDKQDPVIASPLDKIKFVPINENEFYELQKM